MAKKAHIGIGKKLALAAAIIATATAPVATVQTVQAQTQTAQANTVKRDATPAVIQAPRLFGQQRNIINGGGFGNGNASRLLNQRQYRKQCRQNPSLYRSKKHRSKN